MGRPAVIGVALLAAGVLAGCGAEGVISPTPATVVGKSPTTTTSFPIVPAFHLHGDPTKGKTIFTANCSSCHTLAAAHSTGTVGPNLDQLKPDYRAATAQATNGGGVMPAFKTQLSTQQIADVAAFVVDSTGGKAP